MFKVQNVRVGHLWNLITWNYCLAGNSESKSQLLLIVAASSYLADLALQRVVQTWLVFTMTSRDSWLSS